MQLTLLIPELIWPEPEDRTTLDALACPALHTLLARSRRSQRPAQSLEATLSDFFGHPAGAPYAAFRLLGETANAPDAGDACWINADPVHLRFHQERLILADSGRFALEYAEAQALADELNRHLADTGHFHVAAAGRWYLQLADRQLAGDFDAPPLSAVSGRSIERLLPEAGKAKTLRKLQNEIQMLLHAHPLNQQRENVGQMTINSLWLWGAGSVPERRATACDGVWSLDPLARGLARAAGVPVHPVPATASALFDHSAADTEHLVVLDDLLDAVHYENGDAYRTALLRLENDWFAPLRTALHSGRLNRLRIEAPSAYATLTWDSGRLDQWKFWRRPQTLGELARQLAAAHQ